MAARRRSKTLNKVRRLLERRKPFKTPKATILIVCEGKKTEPIYFQALRRDRGISPGQMQIDEGEGGSHPKSVVEHAKFLKGGIEREGLIVDIVWCVFDRDDHAKIEEAFIQARDNQFQIAFSNPCFELWYLLHYQDQRSHIERKQVFSKLKKDLPQYEKSANVYQNLSINQSKAISRAKKLRKLHRDNQDSEMKNPSTSIDCLVSYLNSL